MKVITLLTILLICNNCLFSQMNNSLSLAFRKADSVFLISHKTVSSALDRPTESQKKIELFTDGHLNDSIVTEKKLLTRQQIAELVSILRKPPPKNVPPSEGGCFDPHHAILLKTGGEISYMQICFNCRSYINSSNLEGVNFSFEKFEELRGYFIKRGLKFRLSKT